jgi:transketolase
MSDLDQMNVDTIRFLAVNAVEEANSGHPGLPLGAAPMAYTVWDRFLCHDATDPSWFNQDRFIVSPGHSLPSFIGGSADLSPSTMTDLVVYADFGFTVDAGVDRAVALIGRS